MSDSRGTQTAARDVRRGVAALLMSGLLLVIGLAPVLAQEAEVDPRGEIGGYDAGGIGAPFGVQFFEPVLPVPVNPGEPHLVAEYAWTSTKLNTGPQGRAVGSQLWPGGLVGDGFPTIAALVLGSDAPPYPMKAEAQFPGGPHETNQPPAPNAPMRATTIDYLAHGFANTGDTGTDEQFANGQFQSDSRSEIVDGVLTTTVVSTAKDVDILDGTITIDSVETTIVLTSDATIATSSGQTEVSGLRIMGQGYTVDENGVQPVEDGGGGSPLIPNPVTPAINDDATLRDAFGINVRLVGHEEAIDQNRAARSAGGLVVEIDMSVLRPQGDVVEDGFRDITDQIWNSRPATPPGCLPGGEDLCSNVPVKLDQSPYVNLLPVFLAQPRVVYTIGRADGSVAANPKLSFDFPVPPPRPTPTATPTAAPRPAAPARSVTTSPTRPVGTTGSAPIAAPAPPLPPVVEVPTSTGGTRLVALDRLLPSDFTGIAPVFLLMALLGAYLGSYGLRTLGAVAFAGGAGCDRGADDELPDLRSAR